MTGVQTCALPICIYSGFDKDGYLNFRISTNDTDEVPLSVFTSKEKAKNKLESLVEKYTLCQKLTGLYESQGACFRYHVSLCRGACCGLESPADYNKRASDASDEFVFRRRNFFIIDRGRDDEERCAVKILNGKYAGYGYFNINEMGFGLTAVHDCIRPYSDNHDVQTILKQYLKTNKVEKIIEF